MNDFSELNDNNAIAYVEFLVRKKFKNFPWQDLEDLVGDGLIGYVDAKKRFSPDTEASFKTYAEYRIMGEIKDALRRKNGRKGQKDIISFGHKTNDESFVEKRDLNYEARLTEEYLYRLNEKERRIVELRMEGLSYVQVAEEMGHISAISVFNIHAKLRERFKDDLEGAEIKRKVKRGNPTELGTELLSQPKKERDKEIRSLRLNGSSLKELVAQTGLNYHTIARVCKGLKPIKSFDTSRYDHLRINISNKKKRR